MEGLGTAITKHRTNKIIYKQKTLEDLRIKRNAVNFAFNDLYDTIQKETYIDTINQLLCQM